jgi:hypothetical protein
MHLGALWGFCVDIEAVEQLEQRVRGSRIVAIERFVNHGFLRYNLTKPRISLEQTLIDLHAGKPVKPQKETGVIKAAVVAAYDVGSIVATCPKCKGARKVPNAGGKKLVGCRRCDTSGFDLDQSKVPRTKGSRCRSCIAAKKKNPHYVCPVCVGEPDVIPGVAAGRDTLAESGDDYLGDFAGYLEDAKILETYLPFLKSGLVDDDDIDDDDDDESPDDESPDNA